MEVGFDCRLGQLPAVEDRHASVDARTVQCRLWISCILHERLEKTLSGGGAPHPPTLRQGRDHLNFHLEYLSWLLEERDWLAGQYFSLADIAAGAHFSCLDYLGEIDWKSWPRLKEWYQKLKSRPSFRPLLKDHIPGLIPPRHYADLDF